jgi:hypothetical protein
MAQSKRLIEVSLPLKAISAQSAREKSIRHGHISTPHTRWTGSASGCDNRWLQCLPCVTMFA